jgi:hypothetical protein
VGVAVWAIVGVLALVLFITSARYLVSRRQRARLGWYRLNPPGFWSKLRHWMFGSPQIPDENVFVETGSAEIVNEVAAPIIALNTVTNDIYMCGMATIIGPGYAITAAHVWEDINNRFGSGPVQDETNFEFTVMMFLTVDQGASFIPIRVVRAWVGFLTDIAVLYFHVPPEATMFKRRWGRPVLQLMPPSVGERVAAFGFTGSGGTLTGDGEWTFDLKPRTSTGRILEIHYDRRDAVRMPFACYRVDARFDASMSGGPVFNSAGNLCGIVCSSIPATADNDEHSSYVTTLWPLLAYRVDSSLAEALVGKPCFAYQLFERGLFLAVDRDQIQVAHAPGERPQLSIRVPGTAPDYYRVRPPETK